MVHVSSDMTSQQTMVEEKAFAHTGDGGRLTADTNQQYDPSLWDFASLNSLKPQLASHKTPAADGVKKEKWKPMRASKDGGWAQSWAVDFSAPPQGQAETTSGVQGGPQNPQGPGSAAADGDLLLS